MMLLKFPIMPSPGVSIQGEGEVAKAPPPPHPAIWASLGRLSHRQQPIPDL